MMSCERLLTAAKAGSISEVREEVLCRGVGIDHCGPTGLTALMIVAGHGDGKMARQILELGADASRCVDNDGHTALVYASQYPAVARILVESGCWMDYADPHGQTLLHLTCRSQAAHEVTGRLNVAQFFIHEGADVNALDGRGISPLHMAAGYGRMALMGLYIRHGADVNSRAEHGVTPLMTAVINRQLHVVQILHKEGADALLPNFEPLARNGKTVLPLEEAAQGGCLDIVHELVKLFGIAGCGGPSGGVGALVDATDHGHLDIMTLLLGAGVVDTGEALFVANANGKYAHMKLLVQRRWGDSEYLDGAGCFGNWLNGKSVPFVQTPLAHHVSSCSPSSPGFVQLLIEAGASLKFGNGLGKYQAMNNRTLIGHMNHIQKAKTTGTDKPATQDQLYKQEALRRVLLRVDAVTATSWAWTSGKGGNGGNGVPTTAREPAVNLTGTMAVLRRRSRRRGVALPAMFRCVFVCIEVLFLFCR